MGLRDGYLDRHWVADNGRLEYRPRVNYFAATRHPWPCFLFIVPLLAAYEIGVATLGSSTTSVRAGVELWLRQWLAQVGPVPPIAIPLGFLALLILWVLWRWADRPDRVFIPVIGMAVEGAVFGVVLYALCLNAPQLLEQAGLPTASAGPTVALAITYLGVGIYEEALFRMIGFGLLSRIMRTLFIPAFGAIPIAILISAAGFALTHQLLQTDKFAPNTFLIHAGIGIYCALVFWLRGFGVAVGAHIVYDLIVGLPR
jgi:membrane protease YdiL (CAAX protease family)